MLTSSRTKSKVGRLDHAKRRLSKRTFAKGNEKICVKSLRYADEYLLSTNNYYLKVARYIQLQNIKPAFFFLPFFPASL